MKAVKIDGVPGLVASVLSRLTKPLGFILVAAWWLRPHRNVRIQVVLCRCRATAVRRHQPHERTYNPAPLYLSQAAVPWFLIRSYGRVVR